MRRALIIAAAIIAAALAWTPVLRGLAPPANSPFLIKANQFADEYNALIHELQFDVADRRRFQRVAKLWDALYSDPGWLK